jgi:3-oxocholest-4-en-26-oyl-CoA dehydrogenase beta subunit
VAADAVLGDPAQGRPIVKWLVDRALAGLCAMEAGVVERALRMTAEYTSTREQFGKPIAKFQAVAQRAADAFIDVEAMKWTAWEAVWRLAQGLPADEEIAIAKFWVGDGGHRVVYAAQHLHGGIGIDLDYPLYRSYVWSKQIELTLGSATQHLVRLGAALAGAGSM